MTPDRRIRSRTNTPTPHTPNAHPNTGQHTLTCSPCSPHTHPHITWGTPTRLLPTLTPTHRLPCPSALWRPHCCSLPPENLRPPFRTRRPCALISPFAGSGLAHHKVGRSPGYSVALATSNENSGAPEMPRTRGNHSTQRPGGAGEVGHLPGSQGPAMTWA